jgi:hypothetical protein
MQEKQQNGTVSIGLPTGLPYAPGLPAETGPRIGARQYLRLYSFYSNVEDEMAARRISRRDCTISTATCAV